MFLVPLSRSIWPWSQSERCLQQLLFLNEKSHNQFIVKSVNQSQQRTEEREKNIKHMQGSNETQRHLNESSKQTVGGTRRSLDDDDDCQTDLMTATTCSAILFVFLLQMTNALRNAKNNPVLFLNVFLTSITKHS